MGTSEMLDQHFRIVLERSNATDGRFSHTANPISEVLFFKHIVTLKYGKVTNHSL